MQNWYATASYTNPRGQTFRGAYAAYAVTILVAAANPTAAEAFVRLLLSEKGMTMFERAGFYRFKELRIAGDESVYHSRSGVGSKPVDARMPMSDECARRGVTGRGFADDKHPTSG